MAYQLLYASVLWRSIHTFCAVHENLGHCTRESNAKYYSVEWLMKLKKKKRIVKNRTTKKRFWNVVSALCCVTLHRVPWILRPWLASAVKKSCCTREHSARSTCKWVIYSISFFFFYYFVSSGPFVCFVGFLHFAIVYDVCLLYSILFTPLFLWGGV